MNHAYLAGGVLEGGAGWQIQHPQRLSAGRQLEIAPQGIPKHFTVPLRRWQKQNSRS
jgi:hypothetical protein